jgi:hypothetical protein
MDEPGRSYTTEACTAAAVKRPRRAREGRRMNFPCALGVPSSAILAQDIIDEFFID